MKRCAGFFSRFAKAISRYLIRLLASLLMSPHRTPTTRLGYGKWFRSFDSTRSDAEGPLQHQREKKLTSQSRRIHSLCDVRQSLIHLVNQDQTQVAFLQTFHGAVNGQELPVNFVDSGGAFRTIQTLTQ